MSQGRSLLLLLLSALLLLTGCASGSPTEEAETSTDETSEASTTATDASPAIERAAGTTTGTLEVDGVERTYRLHVPEGLDGEVPLLVALHGGGGSGEQYSSASGWDSVADEEGFVVVYPDGTGPVPTWNAGECCGFAAREDVDDVGFVVALIDQLEVELAIDPDQVVATGHSNGSTMSYRLACELSDRIVAIGVQAAPLTYEGCEPSGPVSVLHVHGAQDANVPIDGGVGVGISGLDWPPVVEGVWLMADAAGCGSEPTVDRTEPGVERSTWDGCAEGSRVELIVVDAGGHGWMRPGGSGARGDADDVGFDSTAQIWEFLSGQLDR
jgi:polyhydroxybutyrate depolymerase